MPPQNDFKAPKKEAPKDYMRDVPKYLEQTTEIEKNNPDLHERLQTEIKKVEEGRKAIATSKELPDVVDVLIQRAREKDLNLKLEKISNLTGDKKIDEAEAKAQSAVDDLQWSATEQQFTTLRKAGETIEDAVDRKTRDLLKPLQEGTNYVDIKPEDWKIEDAEKIDGPSDKTIDKTAEFLIQYLKEKDLKPEDSPKAFIEGIIEDLKNKQGAFRPDSAWASFTKKIGITKNISEFIKHNTSSIPSFIREINWNDESIEKLKKSWERAYEKYRN